MTSRENNEILDAFVLCLILSVLWGAFLTGLSFYFIEDILAFLNPDAEVQSASMLYLKFLLYCTPFYYVCAATRGLLISVGKAWVVSGIGVSIQIINVIVTVMLAFGMAGAPDLGVVGIGLGTLAAFASGAVLYASAAAQAIVQQKLRLGALTPHLVLDIVTKAILSASQVTIYALGLLSSYWIVGQFGVLVVAVYQVISQTALLPLYAANALGTVAINQVGQALGAKDQMGVQQLGMKIIVSAVLIVGCYALLVFGFAKEVLFLLLEETINAPHLLTVFALSCLILPINVAGVVSNFVLQGAQRFRRVWVVSAIAQWCVFLPLAYLLGGTMHYGLAGVILADFIYRSGLFFVQFRFWKGPREPALA